MINRKNPSPRRSRGLLVYKLNGDPKRARSREVPVHMGRRTPGKRQTVFTGEDQLTKKKVREIMADHAIYPQG